MILDAQNMFSDAQAVTATAVSTNAIDLKAASIDLGMGEDLYLVVNVDVAMTDSGSDSTIAVALVTDDNAALSTATAVQTIGTFAALSAIGSRLVAKIQPGLTLERYLGVSYTAANGSLTTGSFSAYLTKDIGVIKHYADNITIS